MASHEGTTLKQNIPRQEQDLPGLQKEMAPEPFDTSLETGHGPTEYKGSGRLRGKAALITGGDSGIGRAVAILFAREGADVSIVHLPEEQKDADDTIRAIQAEGREGRSIPFDLERFKEVDQVVKQHVERFGRIDILVNNAAKQTLEEDFVKIDLDTVESVFKTNILQMFAITKFSVPYMKKGSSIINTTSVTTYQGSPAMVDYTATKGAIGL
ncbi:hypothetical protein NLI96_g12221 [Meripilus lineatus]|uniref:Uncharacterized protein n=1 Tax=Meripilus lineatus TaxID=2056292 RepID=A0AAD5UQE5_9APHY|nr:hypothetical protein NLI96_g12221 [Physisporinus lineatus]